MHPFLHRRFNLTYIACISLSILSLLASNHKGLGQQLREDTIQSLTLDDAVTIALDNNFEIKHSRLQIEKAGYQKKQAIQIKPTKAQLWQGQINCMYHDHSLEIEQNFGSPIESYYLSKKASHQEKLKEKAHELTKNMVEKETKLAYFDWIYLYHKKRLVKDLMDYYREFSRISNIQNDLGETDELIRLTAEDKFMKSKTDLKNIRSQINIAENKLKMLLNTKHSLLPVTDTLSLYKIKHQPLTGENPISTLEEEYLQEKVSVRNYEIKAQKAKFFPEIYAGYFSQQINRTGGFEGWMAGISVPLWFFPQKARVEQARIDKIIAENNYSHQLKKQETAIKNLSHKLNIHHEDIVYFYSTGLNRAELILEKAETRLAKEDIDYDKYLDYIVKAYEIKTDYLNAVKNYNKTAVKLEYYVK
jgi:cobalt-zinc-cadmium resistance protein CzcA